MIIRCLRVLLVRGPLASALIILVCSLGLSAAFAEVPADDVAEARFRFDPDGYGILLPVNFAGRRVSFLLDTGFTCSVFDASFREQLGRPLRAVTLETSDGGSRQVELFSPPPATIGGMKLIGVSKVTCVDLAGIRSAADGEIYGVIGMDFLMSRVVRIDFDNGEIAFPRSVANESGSAVPLGLTPQGPAVTLSIEGLGRRMFLVDTGACGFWNGRIDAQSLDALLAKGEAAVVGKTGVLTVVNNRSENRDVSVRNVSLGDFSHRGLVFCESAGQNTLALGYLSRYVVTFDFPRMKMYLKPGRRFDEPARCDLSGASVYRVDGAITIVGVDKGSAAELAGLKEGDVLERLGGSPAESLSLQRIRGALCIAGQHALHIRRGKETLDIALVLNESGKLLLSPNR